MEFLKQHQIHFRWVFLGTAPVLLAVWFWQFPLKMPSDLQDVIIEGLILGAVAAAYLLSCSLPTTGSSWGSGCSVSAC